jgi:hypothetical protein
MSEARVERPLRRDGTVADKPLTAYDLMETNALRTYTRYMRRASGRVALARYQFHDPVTGDVLINGITSDGEWQKLLQRVREDWGNAKGAAKDGSKKADRDVKNLELAYNSILGRPLTDADPDTAWALRQVGRFNFSRILNQVGFAQIAEYGKPIASLGWKATMQHFPTLRRIVRQDGESILKSGIADDVENIFGIGTDRLRDFGDTRFDVMDDLHTDPRFGWRGNVERTLTKANRVTAELSGLTQSTIMQERWVGNAIVQTFADMAGGAKGLPVERLRDLGLSEDMTKRIFAMFNEAGNVEKVPGVTPRAKVARLHLDRWTDKEAAIAFRLAGRRLAHNLVQRNDIGALLPFMKHPLARTVMQFRTFMVGAYAKDTLKNLHFRDAIAAKTLAFTTGLAGLSYVLQTKLASIGRSDSEEYLRDRLSVDNIAKASFARSGTSSILPMLIDTARYATGQDPWFSHTRTSGQVSNLFFGNPGTGLIDDATHATRALAGLFEDRRWSQDEARAIARVMMFGNLLPVTLGMNALISDLPEHAGD